MTMLERVSAAILPAFDHIPDKEYRKIIAGCWARAAIEVMQEPTPDMEDAMNGATASTGRELYRRAIKAALAPVA